MVNYLRELAEDQDRDRSFCISQIVREHAARKGRPLPPATDPHTMFVLPKAPWP